MSSKTGDYFEDEKAWKKYITFEDEEDVPATEILYFPIHSPRTSAGAPRWMGCLPEVMGSREVSEVNYWHFKNNAIPAMAILVSGGKLAKGAIRKIEDKLKTEIKGNKSFDKIIAIECELSNQAIQESNKNPRIELKPLMQRDEAMFMAYDSNNEDKVRKQFRNPPFLLGATEKINRATAEVARTYAEEQVYQPLREEFDYTINETVIIDLGANYHLFKTNAPTMNNPELLSKMINEAIKAGVLVPEEGRELYEGVFNREFLNIQDYWVKQPMPLTVAGFVPGEEGIQLSEEEVKKNRRKANMSKLMHYAAKVGQDEELLQSIYGNMTEEIEKIAEEEYVIKISEEDMRELVDY